ncbi:MAG: FtsX-like permease family protein, partial [Candidatus Heimdallarchaeota archaeon]
LVSAAVVAAVPGFFQDQWGKVDLVAEGREGELPLIKFTDDLEAFPGIVKASFIQEKRTVVEDVNSYVFGVDPIKYAFFAENSFDSLLDLHPVYWLNQSNLGSHSTNGTYILISHLLQQKLLLPLGSNLSIQIADKNTVNVTVAAVIKSNVFLENGEYLYLTSNRFKEFFNSSEAKWFLCDVDDADITKTAVDVQASFPQLKEDGVIAIEYYTQALERSLIFQSALFHVLFIESFSLAALSQSMCILVSTLRMEREMGIARSLGLNRRGVFDIFLAESMALGLAGAILGVFDGFLGAILLGWYISLSVPIQILLRIDNIILWFIISLSVSLFSTLLPSYRSSRRNIVAAISGRPMSRPIAESVKLGPFLKEHSFQLQILFLFLIGILTSKYILDRNSLIIGLIPFDLITQSFNFFQAEDLSFNTEITVIGNYFSEVFNLNILIPILFSLIIIGPISFFILTNKFPKNLGKEGFYSSLSGIIGMGLMICVLTFLFLVNSIYKFFLIHPLSNEIQNINWLIADLLVISYEIISSLVIIFIELMMFQIIWTFIVSRGVNSDLPLKQRIIWIRKSGSKIQISFFLIILTHGLIQMVFLALHPFTTEIISDPYLRYRYPLLMLANPLMFFFTAISESCFFLLLISYPLILLKKRPPEFINV